MTVSDFSYADPRAVSLREHVPPPPYVLGFYGRPGSGKGTQIKRIATALGCHVIGMGDELRRIANTPADPDQAVCQNILDHGELAPIPLASRITRELVQQLTFRWLCKRREWHTGRHGVIFDGIIRAAVQAPYLQALLDHGGCGHLKMIEIDVPAVECSQRLLQRRRHDDTPEQIARRLAIFDANRAAVMGYYTDGEHRLPSGYTIDGSGTVDDVTARLFERLPAILA